MASSANPVILFVTGGWHLPKAYDELKEQLVALGYEFICPKLASMGADTHGLTWKDDVALIQNIAIPLFNQGREVVIVGHSYGGIPACAATKGLGVHERAAEGKPGGFKYIIYLAAFAIPKPGMDLLQTFGGSWAPWMNSAVPYSLNELITVNEKAKHAFYNDIPDDKAQKFFEQLVPHSQDAFETGVDYIAADLTIPKAYIVCELDQAIKVEIQDYLTTSISGFKVERMRTGHSPFIAQPQECAEIISNLIKEA